MLDTFRFCPRCGQPLVQQDHAGRPRACCVAEGCGFVHWNNPTPVLAALIEHEGQMLLARNKAWPDKVFALVTGFLEQGESPQQGVLREVKEEIGLDGEVVELIGVYEFELRNELIIAYHVKTQGTVQLGDELAAYKLIPRDKLRPWAFGTGLAVADWISRNVK